MTEACVEWACVTNKVYQKMKGMFVFTTDSSLQNSYTIRVHPKNHAQVYQFVPHCICFWYTIRVNNHACATQVSASVEE